MEPTNWAQALQVFYIGFGGVFVCLIILLLSVTLYSLLVKRLPSPDPEGGSKRSRGR